MIDHPPTPPHKPWPLRAVPPAGRLLLELLVVFVGVYAAFALAQHQAARDEAARRAALRHALAEELAVIAAKGRAGDAEFASLEAYVAAMNQGARPPLRPLNTYVPFSPDVWQAALASGGVELLEPAQVVRLSGFYSRVLALGRQIERADAYTRTLLLPNIDQPPSEFYDADGRLRPKYHWYRQHLQRMVSEARAITTRADTLRALLLE